MVRPGQIASALGTAFRNENVRRVELAWGAAVAAEWAHFVGLGVFAFQQGGSSAVGVAGLVRLLPAAAIAPFACGVQKLGPPANSDVSGAPVNVVVPARAVDHLIASAVGGYI